MEAGRSTSEAPLVNFDLAGPEEQQARLLRLGLQQLRAPRAPWPGRRGPRSGFFGWLTGNGKMAVRGGYSIVYDRIGTALASNFDKEGSFGMSTNLSSPFGGHNEDDPSIRFQGIDWIPPTLPDAPPGGFPQTPPQYAGVITSALDGTIVTPYNHTFNVVVGRELGQGFSFEAAYVGRRGRNLLVRRDAAMPANLKDPASGLDYFTAVGQLIGAAQGIDGNAPLSAYSGIASHPYWENMFPDAAVDGLTATQRMASEFNAHAPGLHHGAVRRRSSSASRRAASSASSRSSRPQYDTLGHPEHDRARRVRRDAAVAAQALQRGLPVRRELHARLRPRTTGRCSKATRRSATSTTAATPAS